MEAKSIVSFLFSITTTRRKRRASQITQPLPSPPCLINSKDMRNVLPLILTEWMERKDFKSIMLTCKYWRDVMFKSFDPSSGKWLRTAFIEPTGKVLSYYLRFDKCRESMRSHIKNTCLKREESLSAQERLFIECCIHGISAESTQHFTYLIEADLLKIPCCEKNCWLYLLYNQDSGTNPKILDLFTSRYKNGIPKSTTLELVMYYQNKRSHFKFDDKELIYSGYEIDLVIANNCKEISLDWSNFLDDDETQMSLYDTYNYMVAACMLGMIDALKFFHEECGCKVKGEKLLVQSCKYGQTK